MKTPLIALFLFLPSTGFGGDDVGINVHHGGPDLLDAAAALGLTWVRMDGSWDVMEPADDAHQWGLLDDAVDGAAARGLQVFISLGGTPAWVARHGDSDGFAYNDVPNGSSEWSDFVADAVVHFRMRGVRHFGMWNEVNLRGFFEGSADEYVDIIANPGAAAVRSVCADCLVLGPELAYVGDADDYLEAVLQATPGTWDIITHHNYGNFPETGWTIFDGDNYMNQLDQQRFSFTRRDLRQILDGVGWTGEVWITETGYDAVPGDANDEQLQAIYVRRVLEEQLARPWYTNTFFYEMSDCGIDYPGCTIDGYGLIRATSGAPGQRSFPQDFRSKPAFDEIQQFIQNNPTIVGGSIPPPPERLSAEPAAITIDGDLSDFDASGWIALDEASWRGAEVLSGPGDLAVRAAARWDATALYLAFEVTDDLHHNDRPPALLWEADSLQVAFDLAQNGGDGYDGDDHELAFALAAAASSFRSHGPPGAAPAEDFAVRRDGSITSYEIRLPIAVLPGLILAEGTIVGFSFLVNESDGGERAGWIEWTRGIGERKEPEWFGELALLGAPPPPSDAGAAQDAGTDAAPIDAESSDSYALDGRVGNDAALDPTDGETADSTIRATGDGGCGCTASRVDAPLFAWIISALGFVWCARRRMRVANRR